MKKIGKKSNVSNEILSLVEKSNWHRNVLASQSFFNNGDTSPTDLDSATYVEYSHI